MKLTGRSLSYSFLLHLLLPGLAHIWWREYLFGVFVFLVMLLGGALALVSFFIDLPVLAVIVILSLPIFFYLFTFFDIARLVKRQQSGIHRGRKYIVIFGAIALLYQLLAPIAPVNFVLRNPPELFLQANNSMSPIYQRGDLLIANRLSYKLNSIATDKPILHSLPKRFAVIRYRSDTGSNETGIVLGLPSERIEIIEGVVIADSYPIIDEPKGGMVLDGDLPLTQVGGYNILVTQVHLGRIDKAEEIEVTQIIGKVSRLL